MFRLSISLLAITFSAVTSAQSSTQTVTVKAPSGKEKTELFVDHTKGTALAMPGKDSPTRVMVTSPNKVRLDFNQGDIGKANTLKDIPKKDTTVHHKVPKKE